MAENSGFLGDLAGIIGMLDFKALPHSAIKGLAFCAEIWL